MINTTSPVVTAIDGIFADPWLLISVVLLLILLPIIFLLLYRQLELTREIKLLKAKAELLSSEGYGKFVAESREWAFSYIEQVQSSLQELVEASEKIDQTIKKLLPNK